MLLFFVCLKKSIPILAYFVKHLVFLFNVSKITNMITNITISGASVAGNILICPLLIYH